MRALFLLLAALPTLAQEVKVGESGERKAARELLLAIYRSESVTKACREHPEGLVTVVIDGKEFTVNCKTRAAYLELLGEA